MRTAGPHVLGEIVFAHLQLSSTGHMICSSAVSSRRVIKGVGLSQLVNFKEQTEQGNGYKLV